jgi:hypothetical protein
MGERNTIVIVALVIFVALAAVCSGVAFVYSLEAESLENTKRLEDELVAKLKVKIDSPTEGINKDIVKVREEITKLDEEIKLRVSDQADTVKIIETKKGEFKTAHENREKVDVQRSNTAKEDTNRINTAYDGLKKTLQVLDDELKKNQDLLADAQRELLEAKSNKQGEIKTEVAALDAARIKRETLEAKLRRMQERQARLDELKPDGQVISADSETNLAVVNIGARQGVRPGMVFDVFDVKKDGQKVRKAKLRLQKVESQQAVAVLLAPRAIPKACPQCGWMTTEKNSYFCPYCRYGEGAYKEQKDAQRLQEGTSAQAVQTPDFLNPVAKGDYISSPFYFGGKNRKPFVFGVAGQPLDHSRQEIGVFLSLNGCSLADQVSVDTDFLIMGIGPTVDKEIRDARGLGVSVMRETDLFDFFGRIGTSSDLLPEETVQSTAIPAKS